MTYNDYDIEYPDQVKEARRGAGDGAPDEGHWSADRCGGRAKPSESGICCRRGVSLQSFVREMAKMNLQVFVTELDVADRKVPGTARDRDAVVAKIYRDYLTMMLAEPNVKAVLTWGISDRYTWLNGQKEVWRADGQQLRPLPFDQNLQPTAAFYAERGCNRQSRWLKSPTVGRADRCRTPATGCRSSPAWPARADCRRARSSTAETLSASPATLPNRPRLDN